ncbi:MAG: hypothetical protein EOP33_04955 [Rickettsiaceae bacterium]|nr:MAG: hypothetical protein EOP33_04955 [Rickettsiaceae bacterium]
MVTSPLKLSSSVMTLDEFGLLNETQQTEYLVQLSQGQLKPKDLHKDLLVPIFTVYSNLDVVKTAGNKIIDLAGSGPKYCASALEQFSKILSIYDKYTQSNILSSFNQKIIKPVNSLVVNISKAASSGSQILYGSAVMSGTHQVLEGIIAFRKSVDSVVTPTISDKVVAAGINSIVGLIAVQAPVLAATIKLVGIPTNISNFLKVENLQKTAASLKNKIDEARTDKVIKEQLDQAQATSEKKKQTVGVNQNTKTGLINTRADKKTFAEHHSKNAAAKRTNVKTRNTTNDQNSKGRGGINR